jgi:hypothetical protein
MRRSIVATAAAVALGWTCTAFAGPKDTAAPKEYIQWVEDYEAAKAEAAERNVPIVFAWHKDH